MKQILLPFLFVFLFITSCDKTASTTSDVQSLNAPVHNMEIADVDQSATDTAIAGGQFQSTDKFTQEDIPPGNPRQTKAIDWSKKIIKTATISTEIKDFNLFSNQIREKVKKYGGYISSEQQNTTEYRLENVVAIKVPVDQFDNAVTDLIKNVDLVEQKQVNSEDVTSEYVDGKSRLEAKKQVRQRYLELLKQAKNMSEILEVQKEINDIQEEIEMVTGRINYLGQSSAMSTIHFTYYQVLKPGVAFDKEPGFVEKMKTAIVNGWYWTGEIIVAFAGIWPLLIVFGGIAYYLKRKAFFNMKKA